MLKIMRRFSRPVQIIFILVGVPFLLWGIMPSDNTKFTNIITINNETIKAEDYWKRYDKVRNQYKETLKEQFTEEMEKKLDLKNNVLNSMLEDKIFLISAIEMGLKISDKELQSAIFNDPNFTRYGIFKKDVYFKTLELNRLTPTEYENILRENMLINRIKMFIGSAMDVNPLEFKDTTLKGKDLENKKREALLNRQELAIRSFVEYKKKQMDIKINKDLLNQ